jgi:hypothetical protein
MSGNGNNPIYPLLSTIDYVVDSVHPTRNYFDRPRLKHAFLSKPLEIPQLKPL